MGKKKEKNQGLELFEVINNIIDLTKNKGLNVEGPAKSDILTLAAHLKITPMQALLLAIFMDRCDDQHIMHRDIANHFNCHTVQILAHAGDIDALVQLRIIRRRRESDHTVFYSVPNSTIEAIRDGRLPKEEIISGLTLPQWLDKVREYLSRRYNDEFTDEELASNLQELVRRNLELPAVQRIKQLGLGDDDLILYMIMSLRFINYNDDCIICSDIEDYVSHQTLIDHTSKLGQGIHVLQTKQLVENNNANGHSNANSWCLTKHSKKDIYAELHLNVKDDKESNRTNLTLHDKIQEKTLYYNSNVTNMVRQLQMLLEKDRMNRVLQKLANKGMRRGFTCLFYGSPGTGKTETALQLARLTGRDVMTVDVPSIRSKWVGETERNIKDLFDRYRQAVNSCEVTPILLFNEADALLNKRNESSVNSVDKMENAMQNIILQEMENFEGIMIATTNLSSSLDAAFERRFLYKVEFEKPTPNERRHIWKALLPDLDDAQALMLAERFDFSGGQIENIARKRIIADILADNDTLDIDGVIESCNNELLDKKSRARIGFGLCG